MKSDVAAALVFDMHNEYGYDDRDADRGTPVRGLKSMFGQKVQIAGLGKDTRVRGSSADFTLELALGDFGAADILLLAETLDLNETAAVTLGALERSFDRRWFAEFMAMKPGAVIEDDNGRKVPAGDSVAYWANGQNVHPTAAESLHRKLQPIYRKSYVVERPAADAVKAIVDQLENGRHVILSFGEHDNELDYMLVSNVLTRRIRQEWVRKTENHKSFGEAPPRPLVIAVEEAHKLLSPTVAGQTAFGTIARELRKYNVTLLIVDQRPSGIDDEVMSQLGTRVTGWLCLLYTSRFTDRLGYLRLILRGKDLGVPVDQLLVAHLQDIYRLRGYDADWAVAVITEVIELLRNDYETLVPVLEAIGEALPELDAAGAMGGF